MSCCAASPTVSASLLRKALLILLFAVRAALIIGLVAKGVFDLSFFTYCALLIGALLEPLGFIGLFVPAVMTFFTRWVFPLIFQTALFVAIAITIIVQINPAVYTANATTFGGPLEWSWLHTGDFIVHQLPAMEMLVLLLAIHHFARVSVRTLWVSASRGARVCYVLYILFAAMIPLTIYGLVEGWNHRYHVGMNPALEWLLIPLLCACIGAAYLVFVLSTDDLDYMNVNKAAAKETVMRARLGLDALAAEMRGATTGAGTGAGTGDARRRDMPRLHDVTLEV